MNKRNISYRLGNRKNTRNTLKNRKIKKGGFKFNNETLKTAVNEWCEDRTAAISQYGHISDWDTSSVTNMKTLFEDKGSFFYSQISLLLFFY